MSTDLIDRLAADLAPVRPRSPWRDAAMLAAVAAALEAGARSAGDLLDAAWADAPAHLQPAAALSMQIGMDREINGKAAGLRTHVMVATASAALGSLSELAALNSGGDTTRIAAQVV